MRFISFEKLRNIVLIFLHIFNEKDFLCDQWSNTYLLLLINKATQINQTTSLLGTFSFHIEVDNLGLVFCLIQFHDKIFICINIKNLKN